MLQCISGDPQPGDASGVLRLYSMRFCPFAQRTRMALIHKKIPLVFKTFQSIKLKNNLSNII